MSGTERDPLAGELVLGVLTPEAEAAAWDRARTDAAFAADVAWWQGALGTLSADLAPIDPPVGAKAEVMARTARERPASSAAPPPPRSNARAWQAIAAALAVVSLVELGLLLTRPQPEVVVREVAGEAPDPADPYVAALVPSDATPPILVSLNVPQGVLSVDPSGLEAGDRAVQLWLLPPGGGAPVSLGLLAPNTDNTVEVPVALAGLDPDLLPSLAISLEPEGGSQTGAPTGPVVASGAVRPLTD